MDLVFDLDRFGIGGGENSSSGDRALKASDVVVDQSERLLVRNAVLFELGFVSLQLRDRLNQSPFTIENIELELRIA